MKKYSVSTRHAVIMLLCCLVPLAALLLISVFGIPLSTIGTAAIVLLCPLLHLVMMRGMGGHHSQAQPYCHGSNEEPASPVTMDEPARPISVKQG